MNLLQRFRLSRVNKMSNEAFLKQMRKPGDMNDFVNIVEWFASKRGCTSIKLSALCYYAYVWGLVFYNKEIAPFVFYKTEDGPVDKRISKIFFGYRATRFQCSRQAQAMDNVLRSTGNSHSILERSKKLWELRSDNFC